jgi:hypothetical protein
MANTFQLIASSTVGSGGASSIDFSSIPSTYDDLCVKISSRDTYSGPALEVFLRLNNNSNNIYTYRRLQGSGSAASSQTGGDTKMFVGGHPGATAASDTFCNIEVYIPNYLSSSSKILSVDATFSNNISTSYGYFNAGYTSDTSAVNRVTLLCQTNFAQNSTAYLYGIKKS